MSGDFRTWTKWRKYDIFWPIKLSKQTSYRSKPGFSFSVKYHNKFSSQNFRHYIHVRKSLDKMKRFYEIIYFICFPLNKPKTKYWLSLLLLYFGIHFSLLKKFKVYNQSCKIRKNKAFFKLPFHNIFQPVVRSEVACYMRK